MPHVSTEIINDTTEAFTTWLGKALLIIINMKTNGVVKQKHQQKYIDVKYTLHQTTHNITLHGMVW